MNATKAKAKAAVRDSRRWLECDSPDWLLKNAGAAGTDRKLRLLACACCRRFWDATTAEGRAAVETAERFADGLATDSELAAARWAAVRAAYWAAVRAAYWAADRAAYWAADRAAYWAADRAASWAADLASDRAAERRHQADLFRDIIGNPFRPVALDPRWLTSDVVDLARAVYDERAFERLPILADALMDAGCDDEQVLTHCRGDGPHARGCWVVDLVLGKK